MGGIDSSFFSAHAVDLGVGAWMVLFALRGYSRGLFYELMSLVALLSALAVAFRWTPDVVARYAESIPGPSFLDTGIVFLFLFGITGMALRFLITIIGRMWVSVGHSPANRLGGAAFGLAKGALTLGAAVLMLRTFTPVPALDGTPSPLTGPLEKLNVRVAQSALTRNLAELTSTLFSTIVDAAEIRLRMLAASDNEGP